MKLCIILLFFISIIIFEGGIVYADSQQTNSDNKNTVRTSEQFTFKGTIKGSDETNTTKLDIELEGNMEKTKPELDLNVEKITIKKYHGWNKPELILNLKPDDNNAYPTIAKITSNEFFISEKTKMSIAPDQINPNILKVDNKVDDKLTIVEDSFYPYLGKYIGSITIHTEEFSPKKNSSRI